MQFFEPRYLNLLWLLPGLLLLYSLSRMSWKRRLKRFGNLPTVMQKLIPDYRPQEDMLKLLGLALALFFAVLALARPQWGEETKKVERKGIDLVFLLDTSLSMLAEDVKPNRLKKARMEIKSFVQNLKGDRVGMVAFSGHGFLQTPLTLDYAAFFLFLDSVEVGHVPYPGTSLERALSLALKSFSEQDMKHKAVIVFTDGEDHEGNIDPVIENAKKAGVRVYTVGLGAEEGAPIPLKDEKGRPVGFKKDRAGAMVMTKLNAPLLEKIAKETGGVYFPSTPGETEIEIIQKHLGTLGKRSIQERSVVEREDHYQLFLVLAFLFLVFEMRVRRRTRAGARPAQAGLILLLALGQFGFIDTSGSLAKKGNALFTEKKYESAAESYQKAKVKAPEDRTIRYNLGTALYRLDEYQEARAELEKSLQDAEKIKDPALAANAYYNLGNTYYRLGEFEKAIEAYKKTLDIDPDDEDAKYNLEFLQKTKDRMDKKDQEQKEQDQQQQQNQQQNQNQQQQQQQ
ncbi:MAG: tetratricopeptide repeat protein, partial [Candidatus Omnitrophota bacterium]